MVDKKTKKSFVSVIGADKKFLKRKKLTDYELKKLRERFPKSTFKKFK